jgi:taurine dioxygenase
VTATVIKHLGVCAVEVRGLSLCDPSPPLAGWLRTLLARHGVLVLPGQHLDDRGLVALLRSLGRLTFTVGETPVEGHPDLNVVTNVGRTSPPRSNFHTDTSYVARPPAYTALRAVEVPAAGGATQFASSFRAHDTLPAHLRARMAGRTITHAATGVELGPGDQASAEHPVIRRHPLTGRLALYLSTPQRCRAISGLPDGEAADLVRLLYAHATDPSLVVTHHWAPGDVVIWDNACVLHRADHDGALGDRVLHRGLVMTYGPAA